MFENINGKGGIDQNHDQNSLQHPK